MESLHAGPIGIDEQLLQVLVVVQDRARGQPGLLGHLVELHGNSVLGHRSLRSDQEVCLALLRPGHGRRVGNFEFEFSFLGKFLICRRRMLFHVLNPG